MIESVGSKLRKARIARSLSLEEVARATHIRERYIEALEEGNYGEMASHVQVRGFLRSYADFLGLDSKELLAALRQGQTVSEPEKIQSAQTTQEPSPENPYSIFHEIGQALQHSRDLLSLTHDEVEQHTHIPRHYIMLLESGDFESFPSPTQARGMLNNYTNFLNMDTEGVLLRYAEGLQSGLAARQSAQPQIQTRSQEKSNLRLPLWIKKLISADLIFAVVLVIVMVSFIFWSINRIASTQANQEAQPTAPSLAEVLLPTSTPVPIPTLIPTLQESPQDVESQNGAVQETETPIEITLPPANLEAIQLVVVIRQRTWLRVTIDGEIELEARLAPGETYTFFGDEQIELYTSNAAAIQVFFGEQDLGPMGIFGEIVNLIYTTQGIITPTPTATPTIDITPSVELSATPSPTQAPDEGPVNP
ncbi:MAG: DUF4115 domain-containing protein [Chloroflexi bacterium]|nr:DUF4115 domain-containing protein [Chloroflexota bacterium]